MILKIKDHHKYSYPKSIQEVELTYVAASIHPIYHNWTILVTSPDGEFHSVKREHVIKVTKLSQVLK